MATKNGNELQQAMALLIRDQAQFLSHLAETHKRQAETDRPAEAGYCRGAAQFGLWHDLSNNPD